jgi:UDP-glucose 4-epimerase
VENVLVTGVAGFIGSNLVDALLSEGYNVRVLDNFITGHRANLAHCLNDIELVEGDIRDDETVVSAVRGIDMILHEAALPSVPRSIAAPVVSDSVNVGGTIRLLSAAQKAGVQRVVMASSSSVYGDTEILPKTEEMTPRPMSPYAVTKLTGEHYLRVFSELHGIETLSIRYFNVFGPRQDPTSQYSGVIAKFMNAAVQESTYTVCGDGLQSRDFTYIDNVVNGNLLALKAPQLGGEVVNVACNDRITLLEMIDGLNAIIGKELPVEFLPSRKGDVKHSQAGIEKAKVLLGYEPTVSFAEGLKKTLDWYRDSSGC